MGEKYGFHHVPDELMDLAFRSLSREEIKSDDAKKQIIKREIIAKWVRQSAHSDFETLIDILRSRYAEWADMVIWADYVGLTGSDIWDIATMYGCIPNLTGKNFDIPAARFGDVWSEIHKSYPWRQLAANARAGAWVAFKQYLAEPPKQKPAMTDEELYEYLLELY